MAEEWREVFREQMREAKPGHAWRLRSEESLDRARPLKPGWRGAVQGDARASFMCSQCYNTWSSNQVTVLFHLHWERALRQGRVRMRLFRQQCQRCSSGQKETPHFSREDLESVVRRLVLDIREKCYRESVPRQELSEVVVESGGPHKSETCEACQMGLHRGHHGKPDGALHHGKPDGALHQGKPDGALHHGKPGGALYCGSSQSPRYSRIPVSYSYNDASPVRSSQRRGLIQPRQPSPAATASRLRRFCCVLCVINSAFCVILVLFAYWNGWF